MSIGNAVGVEVGMNRSKIPSWLATPPGLALTFILLLFAYLMFLGAQLNWLPWTPDCNRDAACYPGPGETMSTVIGGRYFVMDGSKYWYIQEVSGGTSGSPPLLYTHNVALGAFIPNPA